jgi:hypothetical protein
VAKFHTGMRFNRCFCAKHQDFELTFAFDEVVFPNALEEKKSTIRRRTVRNEMRGPWRDLIAASDF